MRLCWNEEQTRTLALNKGNREEALRGEELRGDFVFQGLGMIKVRLVFEGGNESFG